jgi:hypothetical protein
MDLEPDRDKPEMFDWLQAAAILLLIAAFMAILVWLVLR